MEKPQTNVLEVISLYEVNNKQNCIENGLDTTYDGLSKNQSFNHIQFNYNNNYQKFIINNKQLHIIYYIMYKQNNSTLITYLQYYEQT
jgi:hypothetical protein